MPFPLSIFPLAHALWHIPYIKSEDLSLWASQSPKECAGPFTDTLRPFQGRCCRAYDPTGDTESVKRYFSLRLFLPSLTTFRVEAVWISFP